MFTMILPIMLVTVLTSVLLIAMHATITRSEALHPATDTFNFPPQSFTSADTIASHTATAQTAFIQHNDWQSVTVRHLGDVTDLLDYLENRGIATKEVVTLDDTHFSVRWK
jgi:hypothetical protein